MTRFRLFASIVVAGAALVLLLDRGARVERTARASPPHTSPAADAAANAASATEEDAPVATAMVVAGEVRDQDDAPVRAARVTLGARVAETDERGRFAFRDVPRDGRHRDVCAEAADHVPARRRLLCKEPHVAVTLHVERCVPLLGRVLDVDGGPVAGARVTAQTPPEAPWRVRTTGRDGAFRFDDATGGVWTVEATHDDCEVPVRIETRLDRGPVELRMRLLPPRTMVRLRWPADVSAFEAWFVCESDVFKRRRLDLRETAALALRPGRWVIHAAAWVGEHERRTHTVVAVGERPKEVALAFPEPAVVEGRIVGGDESVHRIGSIGERDRGAGDVALPRYRLSLAGRDPVLLEATGRHLYGRAMVHPRSGLVVRADVPVAPAGTLLLDVDWPPEERRTRWSTRAPGGDWDPERDVYRANLPLEIPRPPGAWEWRIRYRARGGPLVTRTGTVTVVAGEEVDVLVSR